jgi:hypothetical protein
MNAACAVQLNGLGINSTELLQGKIQMEIKGVRSAKEINLHAASGKCTSSQISICKVNFKGFLFLIFYQT